MHFMEFLNDLHGMGVTLCGDHGHGMIHYIILLSITISIIIPFYYENKMMTNIDPFHKNIYIYFDTRLPYFNRL